MGATCGTLNCKTSKQSFSGSRASIHIMPSEQTLDEKMQLGPYFQQRELKKRASSDYERWNKMLQTEKGGPSSPSKGGGVHIIIG